MRCCAFEDGSVQVSHQNIPEKGFVASATEASIMLLLITILCGISVFFFLGISLGLAGSGQNTVIATLDQFGHHLKNGLRLLA
jgi:hypothetical protein